VIRFHALGVPFSVPLLSLLVPILGPKLGMRLDLTALALALALHETAHIIAAKLTRVDIREVRILPFGGTGEIEALPVFPRTAA